MLEFVEGSETVGASEIHAELSSLMWKFAGARANSSSSFQIPSLNTAINITVYDQKIVRFRGMIQDILNPAYYLEKCKIRDLESNSVYYRSGKYCDIYLKVKNNLCACMYPLFVLNLFSFDPGERSYRGRKI